LIDFIIWSLARVNTTLVLGPYEPDESASHGQTLSFPQARRCCGQRVATVGRNPAGSNWKISYAAANLPVNHRNAVQTSRASQLAHSLRLHTTRAIGDIFTTEKGISPAVALFGHGLSVGDVFM
jgi:hypothetical protein